MVDLKEGLSGRLANAIYESPSEMSEMLKEGSIAEMTPPVGQHNNSPTLPLHSAHTSLSLKAAAVPRFL